MKKWSKFFTVALAMAGFLFAGTPQACSQQPDADAAGYIVKVGDMAPDFEMTLTDGTQVKLSSLRGKSGYVAVYSQLVWSMPERDAFY
mgnify:CR=1 FL=1